jgi:hypothetical protein
MSRAFAGLFRLAAAASAVAALISPAAAAETVNAYPI